MLMRHRDKVTVSVGIFLVCMVERDKKRKPLFSIDSHQLDLLRSLEINTFIVCA